MNPCSLILLRGVPGSGKSTLATLMATIPGAVAVTADDYPGRYMHRVGGLEYFPDLSQQAHQWCLDQVATYLERRCSVVIVHNTFISLSSIRAYRELAERFSYRTIVIKVEGNFCSVHRVPEDVIEEMRKVYEEYKGEECLASI